jgi:hypothetical protein
VRIRAALVNAAPERRPVTVNEPGVSPRLFLKRAVQ